MKFSIKDLRKRFPQTAFMDSQGETYLDSASTSLKIDLVWKFLKDFYETGVSNVHRGEHYLSLKATERYEKARSSVARFLGAADSSEIVFTRGTTEGLNFLAGTLSESLQEGDEILVSEMEHHSNFLPWQQLAHKLKLKFKIAPVNENGLMEISDFKKLLSQKTKIVSFSHVSNVTGVINPIEELVSLARKTPAFVIVDAAQSAPLLSIDVQKMDCDFLVFSGHKIFSPSGIGVLYGKKSHLTKLPPYHTGGGMIFKVSRDEAEWAEVPYRFEAGTPFIEGALVLAEVLSFLKKELDFHAILKWEQDLVLQARESLLDLPGIQIIGSKENYSNILSFVVDGIHSSDIAFLLAKQKLALRAGHHCCMPLMQTLGLNSGTVRASFSVYNREEDVEALQAGIVKALSILRN